MHFSIILSHIYLKGEIDKMVKLNFVKEKISFRLCLLVLVGQSSLLISFKPVSSYKGQ